ncbi:MAG: hypothetical protein U1E38_02535 [Rhodospirillales bacterium]
MWLMVKNTAAITVNPNISLERKAQTFRLTGIGDVTIAGVMGELVAALRLPSPRLRYLLLVLGAQSGPGHR